MRFLILPALCLAALGCTRSVVSQTDPADLVITNVDVVDVATGQIAAGRTVIIGQGRIREVSMRHVTTGGRQTIDGTGLFLVPGLWDAHVHVSFAQAEAMPLFVAYGVTSVRDLGSRLEEARLIANRIEAGDLIGPRIMTSGPILEGAAWMKAAYAIAPAEDPVWDAAPRVIVSAATADHVVDSLRRLGVDLIKARNVWGADFVALAIAAERAGLLFASHNPNRVAMPEAAGLGLDSFEHAESIWGDFDTMTVSRRETMFRRVARTPAMVTPTLMADAGLTVATDSTIIAHLADTVGALDPRNRSLPRHMRTLWREAFRSRAKYGGFAPATFDSILADVRLMHRAGIRFLAGTDAGAIPLVHPGSSVHEELAVLVNRGGLSPLAALQAATSNPAKFFRLDQEFGSVAPGRYADLLLLEANPLTDIRNTQRIAGVIARGRYFDREALDAMRRP